MIKNIIFDIGDVLADFDYNSYLKSFRFSPEREDRIRKVLFEGPYWAELDREKIPLTELLEKIVALAPDCRDDILRVFVGVHRTIRRREDAIPWILALKERGFHVYYLSNYASWMLDRTADRLDFLPYMDGGVFSYEVKSVKPEREIFRAFLNKYPEVKPDESVLIDDSSANAVTGIAFGFRVILFKSRDKAIRELEKLCGFRIYDEKSGNFVTKEQEERQKAVSDSEYGKCMAGECFDCHDKVFLEFKNTARKLIRQYNGLPYDAENRKAEVLRELFGRMGKNVTVASPFYCDYGRNIFIGNNVSVNMNCTFVDCNTIEIGDNVLISSNVQIYTSSHPVELEERLTPDWDPESGAYFCQTYALPVRIGNGCWIGGGAIILPGVTIGDGTVIGAGSVVTENIPKNCVAAGNPCRIIRRINDGKYTV